MYFKIFGWDKKWLYIFYYHSSFILLTIHYEILLVLTTSSLIEKFDQVDFTN